MAGLPVRNAFPTPLDKFQLDEIIGSGGFSDVYRATDNESKEVLALKCFRQELKTIEHYHVAAKEIAFMKILDHPNIIALKVYEISRTFVYIGTEFAAFGSLKTFLQEKKPLTEKIIKTVMKQLLCALDYMHSLGIFHGDIKPHNILCTNMDADGPVIKICDFGLTEIKLKGCDMIYKAGSFLFMAPEVILKQTVDVTCDLWSAGVLMYMMMFARTVFNIPEKDREKMVNCVRRRIPPLFNGSAKYSSACNSLVKGLLSYDKRDRPQNEALRKHPFLNLDSPKQFGPEFLKKAREHIDSAFGNFRTKKYGDSLVEGTQAVLELKIHYNLIQDEHLRRYFKKKWLEYEEFNHKQETALISLTGPNFLKTNLSDAEFRKHLMSTPKLLDGFDIGCSAEMYLVEGKKEKALQLFRQAMNVMLPILKEEPKSNRRIILALRLEKWINLIETLSQKSPLPPKETDTVPMKETGTVPPKDTGTVPAKDTGTIPAKDRGTVPAKETGTVPAKDTGTVPAKDTGTIPAKDTGTVPAKDTGTVPAKETGTDAGATDNVGEPTLNPASKE